MYQCAYTLTKAALYQVAVLIRDEPLSGSPFKLTLHAADAAADRSVATGNGLSEARAGSAATYSLHMRDEFGNPRHVGGDEVWMSIAGDESRVEAFVDDLANGSYAIRYRVTRSGRFGLEVHLGKAQVVNSPFSLLVVPSHPVAAATSLRGAALTAATAGENQTFAIEAKDEFGNRARPRSVESLAAEIQGDSGATWPVSVAYQREEFVHLCQYNITLTGRYSLRVMVDGEHMAGSPFALVVHAAATSGLHSTISAANLLNNTTEAGVDLLVHAVARDLFGNVQARGGDAFSATLRPAEAGSMTPIIDAVGMDLANGSYILTFAPKVVGAYELSVSANHQAVGRSPLGIAVIPARTYPSSTMSLWDGGNGQILPMLTGSKFMHIAGRNISVIVQTVDAFSNKRIAGGDNVTCQILHLSTSNGTAAPAHDNGDGSYVCTLLETKAAVISLSVSVGNTSAPGSPFSVEVVPGVADASTSVLELLDSALMPAEKRMLENLTVSLTAGGNFTAVLRARDSFGNMRDEGGDVINVSFISSCSDEANECTLLPNNGDVYVADNHDGTYLIAVRLTKSGRYLLGVHLGPVPVANSPASILINADVIDAAHSVAVGTALTSSVAGVNGSFTVEARDRYGNHWNSNTSSPVDVTVEFGDETARHRGNVYSGRYAFTRALHHPSNDVFGYAAFSRVQGWGLQLRLFEHVGRQLSLMGQHQFRADYRKPVRRPDRAERFELDNVTRTELHIGRTRREPGRLPRGHL